MMWILIIVFIVALDQTTKYITASGLKLGESITVIDKFFYIAHWENRGAAWGILQDKRVLFIVLTSVITLTMFYFLFKSSNKLLKLSLSFVIGGAIGNLIDRVTRGSVTDFLDFYIGSYHFPTFNAADTFVVVGTFLLGFYMLFVYKDEESNDNNADEEKVYK